MAAAQEAESGHAVRALSFVAVLVVAKTLMLAGKALPLSAWTPFVFFWQDLLAGIVFFALVAFARSRALGWIVYGAAVAYTAMNVPVTLVLGSPLTWNMLRAARGPLADSIAHHITAYNVGSAALILGIAALLPFGFRRRAFVLRRRAFAGALFVVVIGVLGESKIETRGLQRNAFGALIVRAAPRVNPVVASERFDAGLVTRAPGNLRHLRGAARGRNVLLIVLESTSARYLGLYGAVRDPMPTLTELGRDAVIFEHAYAVYPESIKGLFSTLCSRYPAIDTPAEAHARVPCTSIAQALANMGYRTALFHSGRFNYLGMAATIDGRGFEVLKDAGSIGGEAQSSFGVDEASTVRSMLQWIDSLERDEQFFMMYLPVAGHHPYIAPLPWPFDGDGEFDRYLNALHSGDAALKRLFEGLHARGLDQSTVFVVQADHGEAFGQHPDNFAHSLFIYDENIRVPYLIAAPGLIAGHLRDTRVASAIDTAPTILDLLGYPAAKPHQGRSLLDDETGPAFFYTDYSLGWLGLRDGCWKYLFEIDSGRSKLFDVCSDPDELRDRAGEFEPRAGDYGRRVRHWVSVQQDAVRSGR